MPKRGQNPESVVYIVPPFLDTSSYITPYSYAKALANDYDVRVLGFNRAPRGKAYIADEAVHVVKVLPDFLPFTTVRCAFGAVSTWVALTVLPKGTIHCFKPRPHTLLPCLLAKMLTGKKLVVTVDDYEKGTRNPLSRAILGAMEPLMKFADVITVSSTGLKALYGGEVIYQQVTDEAHPMVLYAGTIYPFKGLKELIRAVQKCAYKPHLIIAGDGDKKYIASLKKIAGPETSFLGRVPKPVVRHLIEQCDVFAIPTLKTEYSEKEIPGKIFEAMERGKCIVASAVSDIPIILSNTGILVPPGDVDALAEALNKGITNKKRLGKMAATRYKFVYPKAKFEAKVLIVYDELGEHRPAPAKKHPEVEAAERRAKKMEMVVKEITGDATTHNPWGVEMPL